MDFDFDSVAMVLLVAILISLIPLVVMWAYNSFLGQWLPHISYWQSLAALLLAGVLKGIITNNIEVRK